MLADEDIRRNTLRYCACAQIERAIHLTDRIGKNMGEGKRRAKEIAQLKEQELEWRNALSNEEKLILDLAERLDQRLVRGRHFSEGCYHLAFFMTHYLVLKGIEVTPIVGWVNDGTWQGIASHAWIEYKGKKTDVSLTYTTHPEAVPTGALIVHDHVLRKGQASYTYYKNDDPVVSQKMEWMRSDSEIVDMLAYKGREHQSMMEIISSNNIERYLSMAPPGGRFEDISKIVE